MCGKAVCVWKGKPGPCVCVELCDCTCACPCKQAEQTQSLGRCVAAMTFPQAFIGNQNGAFTGSIFAAVIPKEPRLVCQLLMTFLIQLFKILTFKTRLFHPFYLH